MQRRTRTRNFASDTSLDSRRLRSPILARATAAQRGTWRRCVAARRCPENPGDLPGAFCRMRGVAGERARDKAKKTAPEAPTAKAKPGKLAALRARLEPPMRRARELADRVLADERVK